jgi:hypothetical protein
MQPILRIAGRTRRDIRLIRKGGRRLTAGVYVRSDPESDPGTLPNRARAALAVAPRGSIITGLHGLALAGAEIPFEMGSLLDGPVEVAVPQPLGTYPRRPELSVRRLTNLPPVWKESPPEIPLAHPVHAWAQVSRALAKTAGWRPGDQPGLVLPGGLAAGGSLGFCRAVQLGDALVRRKDPILTFECFADQLEQMRGRYGSRLPLDVFRWVRPRTDSPPETLLRLTVLAVGYPEPLVNPEIQLDGRSNWLDLAWAERKIDLEFHGNLHFEGSQPLGDLYRRRALEALGWTVIEATTSDLRSPKSLLARLAEAFAATEPAP